MFKQHALTALFFFSTICWLGNNVSVMGAPAKNSSDEITNSVRLIEHGEQNKAISILTEIIRKEPTNVDALLARARAYQEINKITEALIDAEKAVAKQPDNIWAICRLAILAGLQKDFPRSIALFNRIIAAQPDRELFYVARADVLVEAKLFKLALADANKALTLSPTDSLAYFRKARADQGLHKLDDAVSDLKQAIRIEHRNYYLRQLGDIYSTQKKFELALKTYKEGATLEPTNALWFAKLTEIGLIMHRPLNEVLSTSNESIRLAPTQSLYYGKRSCIKMALNDDKSALLDLDKAIQLSPMEPLNYFRAACLLEFFGDLNGALDQINHAISIRRSSYFYTCRSEIFMRMRNYQSAIDDANSALALEPTQRKAMGIRSQSYARTGEYEQALDDFEGALSIEQSTHSPKGTTINTKTVNDVAKNYSRVLHLFPDDAEALYNRGFSYLCLGKWKNSAADFDRFVSISSTGNARVYAACFASIAYREASQEAQASKVLLKISSESDFKQQKFPGLLISFSQNKNEPSTVLKAAPTPDDLSRSRCIIGLNLLLRKQNIKGATLLKQVVTSGDPKLDEYSLAQARLKLLSTEAGVSF